MRAARLASSAVLLAAALTAAAQVPEAELKAAYIYNFAVFTTWPADSALQKAPFAVCASTDSALWAGLQTMNGKPVNGRSWLAVDLQHLKGGRCDIVVLSAAAERPASLPPGTLVVRNGAGRGAAAITLVDDEEHIRFDIDTQEAARNGLRFSSRLLRLARNVQ
jgi:hypothetical protein